VEQLSPLCGHSSRSTIARALEQPTRSVLVEVGASRCLLGLAPTGVYPATTVTSRAVSSYLTFSPLPDPSRSSAVCFLWHFPSCCRWQHAQALPGSPPIGARTFLDETSSPRPLDRRSFAPSSARARGTFASDRNIAMRQRRSNVPGKVSSMTSHRAALTAMWLRAP